MPLTSSVHGGVGRFHSLPIRVKLLIIIVGICAFALLLSAALEAALNWTSERRIVTKRLDVTSDVFSRQSRAALEFLDPVAAAENLSSLQADPTIRIACLYNEAGAEFARYQSPDFNVTCPPVRSPGSHTHWYYLETSRDIVHNNRRLGSIYLERDLSDLFNRFMEQGAYKLTIILLVVGLMWPLSAYFQRMISRPVTRLAHITRLFSQDRAHRIKAVKTGDDEIGELVDAFNVMMEEISRNERQLEQAIAELTRSNTELERFAHICSHDLQEPLRMVSNYTALLDRRLQGHLDDETRQFLFFITDGAARMRDLIRDILAYARISHHVEPVQPVDLGALVDYVRQNLNTSISERHGHIHQSALPTVTGNRTLLLQVFQNLLSNAIKFCTTAPEVRIDAVRQEDSWRFSIADNGIGIDPKYHDKIFEIFKQLNRREEFRGTGIGLAIVKKAVEYHGGRIWVESEAGKGTTFFFTIPDQGGEKT